MHPFKIGLNHICESIASLTNYLADETEINDVPGERCQNNQSINSRLL